MSPEQARGTPLDKRADIWAFGIVLFETLTGKPLFAEDTVSDVLAAVLRQDLAWTELPRAERIGFTTAPTRGAVRERGRR